MLAMSITKDEVSHLIEVNNLNQALMSSFEDLLQETLSRIKRANEYTADLQMREIKKLKHSQPHKFQRKANEDQYKFNLKFEEAARQRQVRCAELDEREKLLLERQKHIILADKSESGWFTDRRGIQDLAENSDDERRIFSAERRARSTLSTLKKKRSTSFAADKRLFPCTYIGSPYINGQHSTATSSRSVSIALYVKASSSQHGQFFCLW